MIAGRPRRRRIVAVGLVAACIGANIGMRFTVGSARSDREQATAALASAEARRDAFTAAATTTGAATGRTRSVGAAAATGVEAVVAGTARLDGEVLSATDELGRANTEMGATNARLEAALANIASTAGQIGDLRACLDGVAAASGAARRNDTAAVTAAMQGVADACRRSHAQLGAVDPGVLFPYDFPDPYVLTTSSGYLAYATNSAGGAVQLLRSGDLVNWAFAGTALAHVPAWAVPGATWAPSVLERGGRWVLYYAVRHRDSGRQCISAATAGSPAGPFVDNSSAPLVCELGQGGSIDPSPFIAGDGTAYLLWKSEGETAGGVAVLRSQALAADGLSLVGSSSALATVDAAWEGRTVEGPSMVATAGGLVLLYSANRWDSAAYAVGAARCDSPLGPCRKVGAVLRTSGAMVGPGGAEAFIDAAGAVRVAFHAWQGDDVGHPNSRYLHIGTLTTSGGGVSITL